MLHPMQIVYVAVKKIDLLTHVQPDLSKPIQLTGKMEPRYIAAHGKYDEETHLITVFGKCEIGSIDPKEETPLYLNVELGARFSVIAPDKFPPKDVIGFAEKYARYLIHPFIREHVFALSIRAGFQPIILPALMLPIFRREDMIEKPDVTIKKDNSILVAEAKQLPLQGKKISSKTSK